MKKLYIIGLAVCGLASCKPNIDPDTPSNGEVIVERYLAVGGSTTAGYTDGSLFKTGQNFSFPAILASQFELVGGGDFKQPLLPGNDGYPVPKFILHVYRPGEGCDTSTRIAPKRYDVAPDTFGSSVSIAQDGAYNNTGIPGIRITDYLMTGYAKANPFARRFFANLEWRPIDDIVRVNHTFFTLWAGSNDVLDYALGGGDQSGIQITEAGKFDDAYDSVLTNLVRKGAKGVALNLPDINNIPFFTTIPAKGLTLTKREADDLNIQYNGTAVHFKEGLNYFVVHDGTQPRHVREGEMILLSLPMDSVRCKKWGSAIPLHGRFVLTADEVSKVNAAVAQFNETIMVRSAQKHVAVADMNAFYKTVQSGIGFNGITYNATFVSGSFFSLDGIHPTARGYALIANQVINKINEQYNATIPHADPNKYPGLQFP